MGEQLGEYSEHIEDIAESQERADQENSSQTMASNMRKQALKLSNIDIPSDDETYGDKLTNAVEDLKTSSKNPMVLELLRQADEFSNTANETGEKAGLDYNARQAEILKSSSVLLKAIIAKEAQITRGEHSYGFNEPIVLPENLKGLGVSKEEAYEEYLKILADSLGADLNEVKSAYISMKKNETSNYSSEVFKTNLPNTLIRVGHVSPSNPYIQISIITKNN